MLAFACGLAPHLAIAGVAPALGDASAGAVRALAHCGALFFRGAPHLSGSACSEAHRVKNGQRLGCRPRLGEAGNAAVLTLPCGLAEQFAIAGVAPFRVDANALALRALAHCGALLFRGAPHLKRSAYGADHLRRLDHRFRPNPLARNAAILALPCGLAPHLAIAGVAPALGDAGARAVRALADCGALLFRGAPHLSGSTCGEAPRLMVKTNCHLRLECRPRLGEAGNVAVLALPCGLAPLLAVAGITPMRVDADALALRALAHCGALFFRGAPRLNGSPCQEAVYRNLGFQSR